MITEVVFVYNDINQVKKIEGALKTSSIFHFIDIKSKSGKKEGWAVKNYWGAKLDPFAIAINGDAPIKAFYTEEGKDVVEEVINFIKQDNEDNT